ncbi:F-type H+-transporting ATPase subunit delta, partial [Phenoliferia sp. Uapishka_3]
MFSRVSRSAVRSYATAASSSVVRPTFTPRQSSRFAFFACSRYIHIAGSPNPAPRLVLCSVIRCHRCEGGGNGRRRERQASRGAQEQLIWARKERSGRRGAASERRGRHAKIKIADFQVELMLGLSGKYAGALYSAALKKSAATLKQVETDLTGVASFIKAEPSVAEFLANPVLSAKDKSEGIDSLLKKASKSPSELTRNLFTVLAENGRLYESDKVINNFLEIMSAHRGEVKVIITSAVPLEKDIQNRLEASLKQSVRAAEGKTMIFENKVVPSLLGGVVVDFDDTTIDLSVASKVNKLNASLERSSFLPLLCF